MQWREVSLYPQDYDPVAVIVVIVVFDGAVARFSSS